MCCTGRLPLVGVPPWRTDARARAFVCVPLSSRVVQVLRASEEVRLGCASVERLTQRTLRRGQSLLQQCCAAADSAGGGGGVEGGDESKGVEGGAVARAEGASPDAAGDGALTTLPGACGVLHLAALPRQVRRRPLTVAQAILGNGTPWPPQPHAPTPCFVLTAWLWRLGCGRRQSLGLCSGAWTDAWTSSHGASSAWCTTC